MKKMEYSVLTVPFYRQCFLFVHFHLLLMVSCRTVTWVTFGNEERWLKCEIATHMMQYQWLESYIMFEKCKVYGNSFVTITLAFSVLNFNVEIITAQ